MNKPRKPLSLFEKQVRFNHGYHDAAQAVREGWDNENHNYGFGSALSIKCPEHVLLRHFDATYAQGWFAGYCDAKDGKNTNSSELAWQQALRERKIG